MGPSTTAPDPSSALDAQFVTFIDGERFTYPLGPDSDAVYILHSQGLWDMVRVE